MDKHPILFNKSYYSDENEPNKCLKLFLSHRYSLPDLTNVSESLAMRKKRTVVEKVRYILSREHGVAVYWNTPIRGDMNLNHLRYNDKIQIISSPTYERGYRQQYSIAFSYCEYGPQGPLKIKIYGTPDLIPVRRNLFTMVGPAVRPRSGFIFPKSDVVFMLTSSQRHVPLYLELKRKITEQGDREIIKTYLQLSEKKTKNCIFHLQSPFPDRANYGRFIQYGEPVVLRHKATQSLVGIVHERQRETIFGLECPMRMAKVTEKYMYESRHIFFITCGVD